MFVVNLCGRHDNDARFTCDWKRDATFAAEAERSGCRIWSHAVKWCSSSWWGAQVFVASQVALIDRLIDYETSGCEGEKFKFTRAAPLSMGLFAQSAHCRTKLKSERSSCILILAIVFNARQRKKTRWTTKLLKSKRRKHSVCSPTKSLHWQGKSFKSYVTKWVMSLSESTLLSLISRVV